MVDLRPAFSIALAAFDAERLMLGSDWPICEVAGGYEHVVAALNGLFADLSEEDRSDIRGETAIRCYGLKVA